MSRSASRLLRCFGGTGPEHAGAGNLAVVVLLDAGTTIPASVSAELFVDYAQMNIVGAGMPSALTLVLVSPQNYDGSSTAPHFRIESFDASGRNIQFCGHGALAAAYVLFDSVANGCNELTCESRLQHWQAFRAQVDNNDFVLRYPRPVFTQCAVPQFVSTCFGSSAQAAATIGGDDGYLVLEFASVTTLQEMQPDFTALAQATRRAVIATAATADEGRPACVMRYFAPQYGNPEDSATGSAAVQLAAYWCPRLRAQQLPVHQLSRGGAWLSVGLKDDKVELSGRVEYC